ncbi:hypothetical protein M8818_004324 [Zalaria obscura]|uniref:Uncharacterized protein n=1 Tax=Zalaria obscura TaxID=2024903 RepID=A0ACC3SBM0_9PEZI
MEQGKGCTAGRCWLLRLPNLGHGHNPRPERRLQPRRRPDPSSKRPHSRLHRIRSQNAPAGHSCPEAHPRSSADFQPGNGVGHLVPACFYAHHPLLGPAVSVVQVFWAAGECGQG